MPQTPPLPPSPSTPLDISLISPSAWPTDTDSSYESSFLQASSPSRVSFPLHQGLDTSFNTSFVRPSSAISSLDQLPTIRETPTTLSSSHSMSPLPSSPSSMFISAMLPPPPQARSFSVSTPSLSLSPLEV